MELSIQENRALPMAAAKNVFHITDVFRRVVFQITPVMLGGPDLAEATGLEAHAPEMCSAAIQLPPLTGSPASRRQNY